MAMNEHDVRNTAEERKSGVGDFRVTRRSRITGRERVSPADAIERGRLLESFPDRASAARFVDRLSERDVDVAGVRIIGSDVRLVEIVLGPLGWARATLQGAAAGFVVGILVGLFFGLLDPVAPITSGLLGMLFGALLGFVIGALFGAARRALRGRVGFDSTTTLAAGRYDVIADQEVERSLARETTLAADPRQP